MGGSFSAGSAWRRHDHQLVLASVLLPWLRRNVPKVLQCEVFRLPTAGRQRGSPDSNQILAAYIPYTRRGQPVRPTMLFSHGNAVDLGQMMPFYKCVQAWLGHLIMAHICEGSELV